MGMISKLTTSFMRAFTLLVEAFRGPCQLKGRLFPKYFLQNSNNKQACQERLHGP